MVFAPSHTMHTDADTINDLLQQYGHAYDVVIPDDLFEENTDRLHRSSRSLPKDGPTYRDDRRFHSVHVTDCRGVDRGEKLGDVVVGHLEYVNPEYHPILHALIDYPLWWVKNRILEHNTL